MTPQGMPLNAPRTPLQQALLTSPGSWGWWLRGYQDGFRWGIDEGRRQANEEWTQTTQAACRAAAAAGPPWAELERKRRECRTPALTAEQIRHRALTSWGGSLHPEAAQRPTDRPPAQRRAAHNEQGARVRGGGAT